MTRTESFIDAACVPLDGAGHGTGSLDRANALLIEDPGLAAASIHTAAILGNDADVRRFLALDPAQASATGGPRGWDPLTYLCFSRYLRLDRAGSDGFVRAAAALLDAGASANTGWMEPHHLPGPAWESAIYGAAGVARHPALTRLLLERGADPNDDETPYHAPETYDNEAVETLLASGRLNADSLATMLLRKADWHDSDGMQLLLEHGADPNRTTRWGYTALHQALRRDNAMPKVALLLAHGADPALTTAPDGLSSIVLAARHGRGDVLALLDERGAPAALHGVDRLVAACARGDAAAARSIAWHEPALAGELRSMGGSLLARFAGTGNADGIRLLLELGIAVSAPFVEGDGYWGVPRGSLAIHIAAWRARHAVVRLLIERGSPIDAPDANGRTPLALAVRACVDSHWTGTRTPESVQALLDAGASVKGVPFPSGYADVDAALAARGASSSP